MATTGLWPVKSRLKDVLDYADNPDKTTQKVHVDQDLYQALAYAGNDDKTDRKMYVAGINCPPQRAYEAMMAVKRRYGKQGGNVAYHGYQSFRSGEVTPEEALKIGKETAKRMWGDKYQVLVTVHLNTENVHCHFVVNSVSFRDGTKFGNHQKDHIRLREISDAVCLEYGKTVLKDANFWKGQGRSTYRAGNRSGMTHREMLKRDIESILPYCANGRQFSYQMEALGYRLGRTSEYYAHPTVIAPGWKRAIRLDSLGYSFEVLDERFGKNLDEESKFYARIAHAPRKKQSTALARELQRLSFSVEHSYDTVTVLVDTMFLILVSLLKVSEEIMSPELRNEANNLRRYSRDLQFLQNSGIHTLSDLAKDIERTRRKISALEAERSKADNRRRRAHTPEEIQWARDERRKLTQEITPLRERVKQAERIQEQSPRIYALMQTELKTEIEAYHRARTQSREWSR